MDQHKPRIASAPLRLICPASRTTIAGFFAALLAACAQPQTAPPVALSEGPPGFPEAYYRQAGAQGTPVLRVDSAQSVIVIEVYRGGSLARLGHDHVVAGHEVRGFVAPRAHRADLYLRLDQLVVDEADLRKDARFDTQPSDEDIAGTRRNMLVSLEADKFPFASIHLAAAPEGTQPTGEIVFKGDRMLDVTLTIHGVERTLRTPVAIETTSTALVASGRIALKQTDFGITPLSVLGGAIQVKDDITVRFAIRASTLD